MSKKKKPQAEERKPSVIAKQPSSSRKQVVKWISIGVLICSLLSGLLTFVSAPTIDIGAPRDPNNPLSYPFFVNNNMFVPLFGVTISCKYGELKFEGEETVDTSTLGGQEALHVMGPHQNITAPCQTDVNIQARLTSGMVAIGVSYSPFLWPFKMSTIRQFKADKNGDKNVVWLPK